MSSSAITGPVLADTRRAPAGTAAAPSFAFNDSTGTGVYLVSAGVLGLSTNGAQRVVVDASGNVGIGTASPTAYGAGTRTVSINGSGGAFLDFSYNGVRSGLISADNNVFILDTAGTAPLVFKTVAVERARIDASGRLSVGNNSSSNTIGGLINIESGGLNNQGGFSYYYNASAPNATGFYVNSPQANTGTTNWFAFYSRVAGIDRFIVYGNGDVRNSTGVYGTISDLKLKENIQDTAGKLDDICKLRVVNYNLKEDEAKKKMIGLIAQEVEQVFPGLVDEMADRDEKGEVLESTTKSVKYSLLVPMLVKSIQEQQEIIGKLEARLAALESK